MKKIRCLPFTPSTTMKYAAIPGKDRYLVFNRNVTSSDFYKLGFFDANFSLCQKIDKLDYLKRGLNMEEFFLSQ